MPAFGVHAPRGKWFAVTAIVVLSVAGVRAQNGARRDTLHSFSFSVAIEGFEGQNLGVFRSVDGLSIEYEVVEFREGGSDIIRKLPGATKYPNIVLKRGFTGDPTLYDWFQSISRQSPRKVNGVIVMLGATGVEVARFQFVNGFPVKWEGPDFDASGNDIPIETIEIAHEGLTMITPGRP